MICPDARVIHITHGVNPQAVGQGARLLAGAIRYLPVGVHLAVVDPGVGSERRAVALRSGDGRLFVGPDNGLLVPAAEASGGIVEAVSIENTEYMLHPVSRTFHGRDVFSPTAAHLASGVELSELGSALDPADLVRRDDPGHRLTDSLLEAEVQYIDRYGNMQLAVTPDELGELFVPGALAEMQADDDRYFVRCAETFADVERGRHRALPGRRGAALGRDQPRRRGRADGNRGGPAGWGSTWRPRLTKDHLTRNAEVLH